MISWTFNGHCLCNDPVGSAQPLADWVHEMRLAKYPRLTLTLFDEHTREWYLIGAYDDYPFMVDGHSSYDDRNDWIRLLRLQFWSPVVVDYSSTRNTSEIVFEFNHVSMITNMEDLTEPVVHHILWRPTATERINPYLWMFPNLRPERIDWSKEGF